MKILIIEDDEKINNALTLGLKEEGFLVTSVLNGKDAWNNIKTQEFDCLILDLMIPEIDGLTLLKNLRQEDIFTPVIILSAKDEVEDKVEGLRKGADDYLAKPFSFNELLARVNSLIRRTSQNQDILKVDNLILNPYTKIITRNNENINLSGKDYYLLEYLMRNKGSILSEDRISRYLWRYEEDISSNVVASHIKNLRQKIDKTFPKQKELITTIRGLGYKIDG